MAESELETVPTPDTTAPVAIEVVPTPEAPVAAPAAKRGRKPKAKVAAQAPEAPVVAEPVVAPVAAPAPKAVRKARVAKPAPAAAPVITKKKPAKLVIKRAVPLKPAPQKETVKMATKTKATDFAAKFQESFKGSAEKAKAAFGDAGEFAKGNVEAVVASTKILATGMKSMSEAYVAETKSAYETMTADIKELSAVKSPTEFFELQSKLLRKNFDAAVASSSKKSEAVLKLANEAFQPLSTRFSLAMEKFKQAA